jgi:hypothetical protein
MALAGYGALVQSDRWQTPRAAMLKAAHERGRDLIRHLISRLRQRPAPRAKIFCIGRNKTGTTSLEAFFFSNGFTLGNQAKAELLIEPWSRKEFAPIVRFARSDQVFQDIPFSLPGTFRVLDEAFPGSRFILTVRASADEWYESLITFHARITRSASKPPTRDELERFVYRGSRVGWLLQVHRLVYGFPAVPLYDRDSYKRHYEQHNEAIVSHFANRPADLLVLNLVEPDAHERLCRFAGLDPGLAFPLPHRNRARER